MTTIAVKEYADRYEIAADTMVSAGYASFCEQEKFRKVPDHFGSGFVISAGDSEWCERIVQEFISSGTLIQTAENIIVEIVHVGKSGIRYTNRGVCWVPCKMLEGCFAIGAGREIALGAMYAGATAQKAVEISSRHTHGTGGRIDVMSVRKG